MSNWCPQFLKICFPIAGTLPKKIRFEERFTEEKNQNQALSFQTVSLAGPLSMEPAIILAPKDSIIEKRSSTAQTMMVFLLRSSTMMRMRMPRILREF